VTHSERLQCTLSSADDGAIRCVISRIPGYLTGTTLRFVDVAQALQWLWDADPPDTMLENHPDAIIALFGKPDGTPALYFWPAHLSHQQHRHAERQSAKRRGRRDDERARYTTRWVSRRRRFV
jgi:hypothetical protein